MQGRLHLKLVKPLQKGQGRQCTMGNDYQWNKLTRLLILKPLPHIHPIHRTHHLPVLLLIRHRTPILPPIMFRHRPRKVLRLLKMLFLKIKRIIIFQLVHHRIKHILRLQLHLRYLAQHRLVEFHRIRLIFLLHPNVHHVNPVAIYFIVLTELKRHYLVFLEIVVATLRLVDRIKVLLIVRSVLRVKATRLSQYLKIPPRQRSGNRRLHRLKRWLRRRLPLYPHQLSALHPPDHQRFLILTVHLGTLKQIVLLVLPRPRTANHIGGMHTLSDNVGLLFALHRLLIRCASLPTLTPLRGA